MSTDSTEPIDLRLLARDRSIESAADAMPSTRIPMPSFPWRTRVLLPATLLIAVALLLGYTARDALRPHTDVQVIPVVLHTVQGGSAETLVQAPGWVEPDPYPVSVPALTDGVVREVLVLEGQPVKAGDVVVRLIDDDARFELARATAELAERQAALEAARRHWDNPIERRRAVASAEARVSEMRAELVRNDAEVVAETAATEQFATRARRMRQAFESNAATELEWVEADLQHQAQRARLDAGNARRAVLEAQLQQQQAELEAARDGLKLRIEETQALATAEAAVALATARRDEAQLRLDRTEVRSPVDGIVMSRFVEPGAKLVMAMDDVHSMHAMRLYDPRRLQVRVDVPLGDAAKVGVGQRARIVVGVLPDRTFEGEVTRIVNEADIQKNTIQVKVAIVDPATDLKPEMLARVRFLPADSGPHESADAVFAPRGLIQQTGAGHAVWVVDGGRGVASLRAVELGETRRGDWVAVKSGLAPGDLLIADPSRVRDGSKVQVTGEAKGGDDAAD